MDLKGEYRIAADKQTVWEGLNNPEVLKNCIPGCEMLEKKSDTEMEATVTAKIGPVKAKFKGQVRLENLNPPESYSIFGEGKGGVAGFAKGGADVVLREEEGDTVLSYVAKAQVGGKLAQLGSRLIDSTARKMANDFFSAFSHHVGGKGEGADIDNSQETKQSPEPTQQKIENQEEIEKQIETITAQAGAIVQEAEEELEVAAGKQILGGPIIWALVVIAAILIILSVTH